MKREILIACPLCGRKGFSVCGLRAHYCRSKPDRSRLSLSEYKTAISAALKAAEGTAALQDASANSAPSKEAA